MKKILIKKGFMGKGKEKAMFTVYEIIKTEKEIEKEKREDELRKIAPYKNLTKKELIFKILELKDSIKDLCYQVGDLEEKL